MRRGRYETTNDWHHVDSISYGTDANMSTITLQACDVIEDGGRVWFFGAYRVTFSGGPRPKGFRSRTWIGETAWSDARRYFDDWYYAGRFLP